MKIYSFINESLSSFIPYLSTRVLKSLVSIFEMKYIELFDDNNDWGDLSSINFSNCSTLNWYSLYSLASWCSFLYCSKNLNNSGLFSNG